jgi:hypothetical protein
MTNTAKTAASESHAQRESEVFEEFSKVGETLKIFTIRAQICLLTPKLKTIQEEIKAIEAEKAKVNELVAQSKFTQEQAQELLYSLEPEVTRKSDAFRRLETTASASGKCADALAAYEAQLELVKIQPAWVEQLIKIGKTKLRIQDLETKVQGAEKSLLNKNEEVEVCQAKIRHLQERRSDIQTAGLDPAVSGSSGNLEEPSFNFRYESVKIMGELRDTTKSLEKLLSDMRPLQSDTTDVVSIDSDVKSTLTVTIRMLGEANDEILILKEKIEKMKPLVATGMKIRVAKLVSVFEPVDSRCLLKDVKETGNRARHDSDALADACTLMHFPEILNKKYNITDFQAMYERLTPAQIWELRHSSKSLDILNWGADFEDWYRRSYVENHDMNPFILEWEKLVHLQETQLWGLFSKEYFENVVEGKEIHQRMKQIYKTGQARMKTRLRRRR